MIVPAQAVRVVIATRPIDFRRGHDSLAAYAQNELKLDPHSGVIMVFRSKRGDRIKVLVWDGSGMVLTYKRLEEGKFAWPAVRDGVIGCRAPSSRRCSTGSTGVGSMGRGACARRLRRSDSGAPQGRHTRSAGR